jgi:hypothetical protein
MDVFHPNDTFKFDNLQLTHPQHITGGSYMTRYSYCDSKHPLYIQSTKTLSKQGTVISGGKKAHIDLLLTSNDGDTEFIEWITNLEKRSVELLYEKRHLWFTQELDHTDIENSFTSPIRAYKTGNFLLRVNLEPNRNFTHIQPFVCKIFDENKKPAPVEYIKAEQTIISIIEFQGIKFTSRNFQIELLLRQVLVIPDVPLFETCVISAEAQVPPTPNAAPSARSSAPVPAPIPAPATVPLPAPVSKETPEPDITMDDGYLGSLSTNEEAYKHIDEPAPETTDDTERYISERPLKHFEYTEVDIDFKNIPDTIDVNEPIFEGLGISSAVITNQPPSHIPPPTPTKQLSTTITLKKHKDVLYEMYKVAKHKACEMKRAAMRAYLEAKEIKATYLLDDLDDYGSDTSDDDSKN